MKVVADESVDGPIVARLRREGHEISYVPEWSPGLADEDVLEVAARTEALLLTGDKDFGELVFRQGLTNSGVMLLRLAGLGAEGKAELVARVLSDHAEKLTDTFSVVTARSVRIRRRP